MKTVEKNLENRLAASAGDNISGNERAGARHTNERPERGFDKRVNSVR